MLIALIILVGLVSFIVKMCLKEDNAESTKKKKRGHEFIEPVKSNQDLDNL
jgi:hypothetical protein